MNHLKTFILLAGLTALFVGVGVLIGGAAGMAIAFAIAVAMNLFSYWNSDKMVLRMYGAQEVDETHPEPLVRTYVADIRDLAGKAGLPQPRVYIMENDQPNAFATGRDPDHAAVAATTGLLSLLDRRQIRGVMAHELAHVRNRDTLTMTITATIAGAISALANFAMFTGGGHNDRDNPGGLIGTIAMMVLAPIAAMLVQMAISRSREYEADRVGAEIAGDPQALASALERMEAYVRGGAYNPEAEHNPATAHMFIVNPLMGRGMDSLFSTHPSTQNRVQRLMDLLRRGGFGLAAGQLQPTLGGSSFTAVPAARKGPWG